MITQTYWFHSHFHRTNIRLKSGTINSGYSVVSLISPGLINYLLTYHSAMSTRLGDKTRSSISKCRAIKASNCQMGIKRVLKRSLPQRHKGRRSTQSSHRRTAKEACNSHRDLPLPLHPHFHLHLPLHSKLHLARRQRQQWKQRRQEERIWRTALLVVGC